MGGGNFAGGAEGEIYFVEAGDVWDENLAAVGCFEIGLAGTGVGEDAGEAGKIDGAAEASGERFQSAVHAI